MKTLINIIKEKLIINKNSKIKKENNPSIENILKYLNDVYNFRSSFINNLWEMDEFYEGHYSKKIINEINNKYNIELKAQNFFCTKPILGENEAQILLKKFIINSNNKYISGILYTKILERLNGVYTYRAAIIYDYNSDSSFVNSEYNKS